MKIKKILKRIAAPLLCVVLSFCVFAFPVSAASSTWSDYHTTLSGLFPDGFQANNPELDMQIEYVTDDNVYTLTPEEVHGDYGIQYRLPVIPDKGDFFLRGRWRGLECEVSQGDTFNMSTWLYGWSNKQFFSNGFKVWFYIYNFDDDGNILEVLKTDELDFPLDVSGNFSADVNTGVTINKKGTIQRIEIIFKGYRTLAEQGRFRYWLRGGITFGYGNPNAPGAPAYPTPDDGDLGRLESTEQELENNTAEGQQELGNIISSQSLTDTLLSYAAGLQMSSKIMLSAITRIPFLNALIWVAMSLGFVASLLGLAGAIVSAADRRAGRDARRSKGGSR